MGQALHDLWYGFGVALVPNHLMWSVFGVLLGNLIGVLPGMGALTAISMLLPLTYVIAPVPAILMLAGIFYGSMYGGAIGAILLNLPSHPPHAVTCIDGYPMTKAGRGGAALGVTMMASFFAASVGILIMIFLSPVLEVVAFKFGPTEISAIMLLGLLAGATMSRGSPLKGVAMTVFGLFVGAVGTDVISGTQRYTFGINELSDGIDLAALSLGLFGIADFLVTINRKVEIKASDAKVQHARHAADQGRAEAGVLPDAARHGGRLPVRRDAGHRADDHHLHRLRAREEDRQGPVALRQGRDRGRRRARGGGALEDPGRLHPDDVARHSRATR